MKRTSVLFVLIFLLASVAIAQSKKEKQAAEEQSIYNAVKNGTTYIVVSDLNFPDHEKYLAWLQKKWTFTKNIQYITMHKNRFDLPVLPGDSFFSLEDYTVNGRYASMTFYYFSFWTVKDDYFKEKAKVSQFRYVILNTNFNHSYFLSSYDDPTFDKSRFFYSNGYPGVVLNIMQNLAMELNTADPVAKTDSASTRISSQDTLYIPEFSFVKDAAFSGAQMNDAQIEKILKNYSLPYKILPQAELEKKIILSEPPFFYVLRTETNFLIMNSKTGKKVYNTAADSRNISANDFKKLEKSLKDIKTR
ncbi:hypothetical protein BEL04_09625 [Mucilaginibacter sp. PPCGB 2223]|uniref:hypothetical protein n=1 Tax=Mucilaginibacter sp. PPCGB 2223 TaxID=1886027 RepID=UPI0008246144|nr:hypothetical protein [Mucilaginibacter sp. PPCGB 2223]OCX54488.1 hypothetical protein BEL04_09625 [Mucilaginibacter sp. PPCGB 2223]